MMKPYGTPLSDSPVTVQGTPFGTDGVPRSEVFPRSEDSSPSVEVVILAGVTCFLVLTSCFIFYKVCKTKCAVSSSFTMLPASFTAPVPILLVYPVENPVFQRAVAALAEFLQHHGGCNVAIDMWQQGKIAEQGPMRWLAEQAKSAERVIILCPQLQPFHCPPKHGVSEQSIPAAAQDLYPLVLHMVASHAKSSSELAKFWAVQFGKPQDKKHGNLLVELRACKKFCLMKDLDKLYRSLHSPFQGSKKTFGLKWKLGISYSKDSTIKLRDAVGQLAKCGPNTVEELQQLKAAITSV
ncbi:interleukin-17 receptor B [Lampris incognitus]|uniref:interleukin-17 receptor B n=1 Tax=Lampris incognitus TaxID=2546036 RepID=UPI0024B5681F|nr:interleukin-17 receptor B [Lampris incognitus]